MKNKIEDLIAEITILFIIPSSLFLLTGYIISLI